ncbi:MAG TPA: EamA family transporter, partial [Dongiaceae bacterium]|nr:EamA family transporter [Dongiaceae bacterium]
MASETMQGTIGARASAVRIDVRLVVALGAVWLFWGSTFAGIRFTLGSMPPFAMASARFFLAGAILYAICAVRGRARATRGDVVRAAVTGASLLLVGNGTTAWVVQYLPTGITSLLLSLTPVWMAIIAFAWGRERPTWLAVAGMLLGFAGLALLLQPKATSALPLLPAVLAVVASVSWAFGSVYQRRAPKSGNLMLVTALQMLIGGALLAVQAAVF